MNTVKYACLRRELILSHLTFFRFLSIHHLTTLAFPFPAGYTKARAVMKRMADSGQVRRFREFGGEFIYHLERKQGWQSVLAINRLYFDMDTRGKVLMYQPELDIYGGRCDGFFVVEHHGIRRKFFCEIDRGTAPFRKADIYNTLMQTSWEGEAWADPLKRGVISFPLVVVLTIRRPVVERDFLKAKFEHKILDLHDPKWEKLFSRKSVEPERMLTKT